MKTNPLIDYVNCLASLHFSGEQKDYYVQRAKDARPVECVRMRDVFTPEQLQFLFKIAGYKTQQKMCFKNSALLVNLLKGLRGVWHLPPVMYVEGYVDNNFFPIEHAFVKIGDKYIDPTFERALHEDVRKDIYVSLIELDPITMAKYLEDTGYYGNLYQYAYLLRNDPKKAEKWRALNPHGK